MYVVLVTDSENSQNLAKMRLFELFAVARQGRGHAAVIGSVVRVRDRRSGRPLDQAEDVRRSRTSIKKGRIDRNGRPLIAECPQPCISYLISGSILTLGLYSLFHPV